MSRSREYKNFNWKIHQIAVVFFWVRQSIEIVEDWFQFQKFVKWIVPLGFFFDHIKLIFGWHPIFYAYSQIYSIALMFNKNRNTRILIELAYIFTVYFCFKSFIHIKSLVAVEHFCFVWKRAHQKSALTRVHVYRILSN